MGSSRSATGASEGDCQEEIRRRASLDLISMANLTQPRILGGLSSWLAEDGVWMVNGPTAPSDIVQSLSVVVPW
jgi:hypothetical protein